MSYRFVKPVIAFVISFSMILTGAIAFAGESITVSDNSAANNWEMEIQDGSGKVAQKSENKSVNTGDNFNGRVPVILILASLVVIILMILLYLIKRRKFK